MNYLDLRSISSDKKYHDAMPLLFDIHLGRLANHLKTSRVHLNLVLTGKRSPSYRLHNDLMAAANELDKERNEYWGDEK